MAPKRSAPRSGPAVSHVSEFGPWAHGDAASPRSPEDPPGTDTGGPGLSGGQLQSLFVRLPESTGKPDREGEMVRHWDLCLLLFALDQTGLGMAQFLLQGRSPECSDTLVYLAWILPEGKGNQGSSWHRGSSQYAQKSCPFIEEAKALVGMKQRISNTGGGFARDLHLFACSSACFLWQVI